MADETAEGIEVDEFDRFFGDGSDMDVDLPKDCALDSKGMSAVNAFNEALESIRYEYCPSCREEGFDINLTHEEICSRCTADTSEPRRWSDGNSANPMPQSEIPSCLKNLTDMEEMLIARTKTVIWTKGRQLCYKDHIINFPQNISEIATKLPRLPQQTDIVIIRREDVDLSHHVDYVVQRKKVRAALQYKIAHDPDYADLGAPDDDALNQLPQNGTVVDRLPVCREGRQADGAPQAAGPKEAANNTVGENDTRAQFVAAFSI
ncbi:ATP-dependent DNA helicase [Favolaschia claudopus]|uniref:ATP-dependent DNA helicase n=1 Tax=Favolaschia claudopus TaxID=2862362 RepID=A0AAW0DCI6_9AGAR